MTEQKTGITNMSEQMRTWKPGQRTTQVADNQNEDGRAAFNCEQRRRTAVEEAIATQHPEQYIDFEAARRHELETFEPAKRSELFHALQRRRAGQ